MDYANTLIIILGLGFFEVIVSVDNAIVNADVLSKMSRWARRWFLIWGFLLAVVIVRGVFPWLLVWISNPGLGIIDAFTAAFGSNQTAYESLQRSAPMLLIGGGTFLLLLFLHWAFKEPKNYGFSAERLIEKESSWFLAVASFTVITISFFALKISHAMAYSSLAGALTYFITDGFKQSAESGKKKFISKNASDWAKILYLEVLDASFSVDSVLGAFAFTVHVPLIMIGNGLGVLVVRQLTVRNIESIGKFRYLKNGAMYSIFSLGILMILKSFGIPIPELIGPLITFSVIGYFFYRSVYDNK